MAALAENVDDSSIDCVPTHNDRGTIATGVPDGSSVAQRSVRLMVHGCCTFSVIMKHSVNQISPSVTNYFASDSCTLAIFILTYHARSVVS